METRRMKEATLRTDGGVRSLQMACAYVILSLDEKEILFQGSKKCGKGTSNCAEYRGLIFGILKCLEEKIEIIHIVLDSQLVVRQITLAAKTNNRELIKHRDKILELLEQFKEWTIKWEGRENNKLADELVNKVFIGKKKNVKK